MCCTFRAIREGDDLIVYHRAEPLATIQDVMQEELSRAFGVFRNDEFALMSLCVPPPSQHQGVGTGLLLELARICVHQSCRRIDVDDMSDRCQQVHNVYARCGFHYRRRGLPEMSASPRAMLSRHEVQNSGGGK